MCSFQKLLKVPTKKGSVARFQKISVYVGRPVWGAVLWTSRFLNPSHSWSTLQLDSCILKQNRIWITWINIFFCCTAPIFRVQPMHPHIFVESAGSFNATSFCSVKVRNSSLSSCTSSSFFLSCWYPQGKKPKQTSCPSMGALVQHKWYNGESILVFHVPRMPSIILDISTLQTPLNELKLRCLDFVVFPHYFFFRCCVLIEFLRIAA